MSIAELRQLPRLKKLQIVEALWSDLATDDSLVQSPSWHGDELRKTEEDLKLGKVRAASWESAKRKLRKQLEEIEDPHFRHRGSFSRADVL